MADMTPNTVDAGPDVSTSSFASSTPTTSLSTWRTYRWMLSVFGRSSWLVVVLCVLQAAMAAIGVGYALMMRGAIDAAVARDESAFVHEAVVFALAIVVQIGLRALVVVVSERARSSMDNRLRSNVFAGVLAAPIADSRRYHSGELMNRLTSDVTVVSGSVVALLPSAVSMVIRIVGVVAVMVVLAPVLTAVFVVGGCAMAGASFLLRGVLKRLHKRVQETEGRVRSFMQECLESLLVIQAFGVLAKVRRQADNRMVDHQRARMRRVFVSAVASTGLSTAMNVGYLIGFVWCGFGILHGTISYGTMMAVIQLIGQIQSPFAMMGGMFPRHAAMLASAERLMDLDAAGAVRGDVAPVDPAESLRSDAARALYSRAGSIRFDHVDFTYGRNEVLRDFSADIRKGDFVAITGRSGIGKSTLMKLLLGAYRPQSGRIGVTLGVASGAAAPEDGRPATLIPPEDIPRGFFAYVPQGNYLMSGTIREAVAFADPDPDSSSIDDDRVREACRIADADSFVEQLPQGYETQLGERGAGLSEGQMQRIAVARALYSRAPLLLLDESTSALDTVTEHAMLERIRALEDRTVLIVTHRHEVLDYCDAVITLGGE